MIFNHFKKFTAYILGVWPPGSLDDVWTSPAFWSSFCGLGPLQDMQDPVRLPRTRGCSDFGSCEARRNNAKLGSVQPQIRYFFWGVIMKTHLPITFTLMFIRSGFWPIPKWPLVGFVGQSNFGNLSSFLTGDDCPDSVFLNPILISTEIGVSTAGQTWGITKLRRLKWVKNETEIQRFTINFACKDSTCSGIPHFRSRPKTLGAPVPKVHPQVTQGCHSVCYMQISRSFSRS